MEVWYNFHFQGLHDSSTCRNISTCVTFIPIQKYLIDPQTFFLCQVSSKHEINKEKEKNVTGDPPLAAHH